MVIVEARKRSGSLITADQALEQGKDVYAVPGRINDPLSEGCLWLIRQGAVPYMDTKDILEGFLPAKKKYISDTGEKNNDKRCSLNGSDEAALYAVLGEDPVGIDRLAKMCGFEACRCIKAMFGLLMEGMAREVSSGLYVKGV